MKINEQNKNNDKILLMTGKFWSIPPISRGEIPTTSSPTAKVFGTRDPIFSTIPENSKPKTIGG